jgi:hypothetical protein
MVKPRRQSDVVNVGGEAFIVGGIIRRYEKLPEDTSTISGLELKIDKAGDIVTGPLNLEYTPTANYHAVNKQYVDGKYPSVDETTGVVRIGLPSGTVMHEVRGYARENSPLTPLNASGSEVINCALRSLHRKIGGTAIITLSGMTENQQVVLIMNAIGSPYSLSFSGESFKWQNAIQPTPTPTTGFVDLYTFFKIGGVVYSNAMLKMG